VLIKKNSKLNVKNNAIKDLFLLLIINANLKEAILSNKNKAKHVLNNQAVFINMENVNSVYLLLLKLMENVQFQTVDKFKLKKLWELILINVLNVDIHLF
jgi:hypothetical protein